MTRKSLKEVLMERDGLEEYEADEEIRDARQEIGDMIYEENAPLEAIEEFIKDRFGLEPDYLEDLFPL